MDSKFFSLSYCTMWSKVKISKLRSLTQQQISEIARLISMNKVYRVTGESKTLIPKVVGRWSRGDDLRKTETEIKVIEMLGKVRKHRRKNTESKIKQKVNQKGPNNKHKHITLTLWDTVRLGGSVLSWLQSRLISKSQTEYTALSDLSLLQAWDPLMLELSLGRSMFALLLVHYLPHHCIENDDIVSKSWRTTLPRVWLTFIPPECWRSVQSNPFFSGAAIKGSDSQMIWNLFGYVVLKYHKNKFCFFMCPTAGF